MHPDTRCKLVALFVGGPALLGYAFYAFFVVALGVPVLATILGG